MSLKDLHLSNIAIVDIYKDQLAIIGGLPPAGSPEKKQVSPKPKQDHQPIRFLGGNEKKITILVSEKEHAYLAEEDLNWLQKMLQACQLTLGDVAIVNFHAQPQSASDIREKLGSKRMILFGVTTAQIDLPLNFPPFKLQEHDGCIYLSAPAAHELNQQGDEARLLKSKLWVCLQKLFEV